jgi:hypothetical protein
MIIENEEDFLNNKSKKLILKCKKCGKLFEANYYYMKKKGYTGLCKSCKIKQTNLERYGVENVSQINEVRQKVEKTCLEKFGSKSNFGTTQFLEQRKNTFIKNYGVESSLSSPKIRKKIEKTNLEKYGVKSTLKNSKIREKIKQTNLKKYGVENPFANKQIKEKIKQTNLERYGVENPAAADIIKRKVKKSYQRKWGGIGLQSPILKEKIEKTNLEKYGVKIPILNNEIRKKALISSGKNNYFEKKFEWFLKGHHFNYEKQIMISDHCFDFAVYDNDNNLKVLVECDGLYFHCRGENEFAFKISKETSDYYDFKRTLSIPEGIKFIVIPENNFELGIKIFWECLNQDYEEYLRNIYNWAINLPFPYPHYNEEKLKLGDNAIRHFHRSIWHCNHKGKLSPYDAWNNKEIMWKLVKNRSIYIDNLCPEKLLIGLSTSKLAERVSLFSSQLAFNLINEFLKNKNEVFDPCSGWSGRLIGAALANKNYIGYDISQQTIEESNQIIKHFNLRNQKVFQKNSLNEYGSFESLFTCPPYGYKESYGSGPIILSAEEWISICLKNFKCKSYLFIVDNPGKFKSNIVKKLEKKSQYGIIKEYVLLFN